MKRYLVILAIMLSLVLCTAGPLSADSPPSFEAFEAESKNQRFVAVVEQAEGTEWKLIVFELVKGNCGTERVEKWSCPYRYSGYPGALVSDDGKSVVYLELWYYAERSVIDFYREGQLVAQVKGKDIAFDRSKMWESASHELWLLVGDDGNEGGAYFDIQGRLVLRTIDGKVQSFDLATGQQ